VRFLYRTSLISVLALRSVLAFAQDAPPPAPEQSTLSVKVRLVSVTALVHDKKGAPVHGLTKNDFLLREDGKPQPVRYFNDDNDLPLTIGLMIDTSGSLRVHTEEERAASSTFLQQMLTRPADRAFILHFDSRIELLQKTTSDMDKLKTALSNLIKFEAADAAAAAEKDKKDHPLHTVGTTQLYSSIGAAARMVIAKEPGRRALIVLTDGDDRGSNISLDDAIRQAQLADVAVYSVLYLPQGAGPGLALSGGIAAGHALANNGNSVMQRIAQETGGRTFVVSKETPITRIYAQIEEDLRSQYRLGFTPTDAKPNSFHSLELKTVDKHLTVQARTGYFSADQ